MGKQHEEDGWGATTWLRALGNETIRRTSFGCWVLQKLTISGHEGGLVDIDRISLASSLLFSRGRQLEAIGVDDVMLRVPPRIVGQHGSPSNKSPVRIVNDEGLQEKSPPVLGRLIPS